MADSDVQLRALRPADDEALTLLFADPATTLWNPGPSATDVPLWRVDNSETGGDFFTVAITTPGAELVGIVSVFAIDDTARTAEIGVRVMPNARGSGVARRGIELAVAQLAVERGPHRIELWHAVGNVAMCHVATACGFVLEEVLKAHYRYGDGALHDEHRHARSWQAHGRQ